MVLKVGVSRQFLRGRCLGQVRVVIFIQILNSFVGGVLGVALPLMMRARLALSGFLIEMCGFMAPFLMSGLIFAVFYVGSHCILKE